ncbi:unnamed protein product [Gongylonema pulchrum]|uniref:Cyclin_C domain-containing protein n=1 Tax=Gongylonema pulchrum TaxID=637853 RepID=A0A183CX78_9BILA|nr:unnamed protein product [Gongylonema pulchrum]
MFFFFNFQQQDSLPTDSFRGVLGSEKCKYERKMIEAFHGDFDCPLSYRFLRRFARVAEKDMRTLTLARYILETSLLFYEFISVPDSMMAAAALLLAMRMIRAGHWVPHYSFLKDAKSRKQCVL